MLNCQFRSKSAIFVLSDLVIWWVTLENNREPLLYLVKLCASFQSHWWIQTWATVRKHSIRVKICHFLVLVTLKFDRRHRKTIGNLFYAASNFVHHFIVISEFKLELQSGNARFGSKSMIFFVSHVLEIEQMTLKNNRAPLLCYFILCALFQSHWWIQSRVTVRKRPIWVKIDDFFNFVWPWNLHMTLEINRTPLLKNIKLFVSFHHQMWIQTGVMVRKQLSWVLAFVTLTVDL